MCNLISKQPLVLALAGLITTTGVLLAIYEIILFICSVIILLKHDACTTCQIPLYTWLVMAITIQATRLISKDTILQFITFIASLVLFEYTVHYYDQHSVCGNDDTNVFFNLMIAHLVVLSIWYAIILIVISIIIIQSVQ